MIADKETVHKLIPQQTPLVMVDTLIYHDEQKTITGFYISNDNLFLENGMFAEEGMIENMAQSAALRSGWIGMENAGVEGFSPTVGVIGSVKNFKLCRNPLADTVLTTEIILIAEVLNASVVSAKVMQANEVLAEAELKIFMQVQE